MMLHVSHGGASDSPDMRNFQPRRVSFDDAHLKEKDKLDARTIATTRDWPMLARANRRKRDEIIGGGDSYRMECRPVWRALPEPFNQKYAEEWGRSVDRLFKADCESPDCWLDAEGQKTHTQILQQGLGTFRGTGEIFALYQWEPGAGEFSTRVKTLDPGLIRDPDDIKNNDNIKGGFELKSSGYAFKAFVHDHLKNKACPPTGRQSDKNKYKALLRKVDGGHRTQWVHIYDDEFPGCTRGRNGFSSALTFVNMMSSYERNVLRAAAVQARHVAFIKSKYPERAFDQYKTTEERVLGALEEIDTFYGEDAIKIDGSVIPHLMPDDEFQDFRPTQPINTFAEFQSSMNLHLAAGADMGYGEYTGDLRNSSYSTARQEDTKAESTNEAIQGNIVNRFADFNAINWLEEQVSSGRVPIKGLNTSRQRLRFFRKYKAFLCNFKWSGARKKHIDPVKTAVSENILINEVGSRLMTDHLAESYNMPIEEWIDRKKLENDMMKDAGLDYLIGGKAESPPPGQGQVRAKTSDLAAAMVTQET